LVPDCSELHRTPQLETGRNVPKSAKLASLVGFSVGKPGFESR
jgi:hypothetical protein